MLQKTIHILRTRRQRFLLAFAAWVGASTLLLILTAYLAYPPIFLSLHSYALPALAAMAAALFAVALILGHRRLPSWGPHFQPSLLPKMGPKAQDRLGQALDLEQNRYHAGSGQEKSNKLPRYLARRYIHETIKELDFSQPSLRAFQLRRRLKLTTIVLLGLALALAVLRGPFVLDVARALSSDMPLAFLAWHNRLEFSQLKAEIIPPAYMGGQGQRKVNLLQKKNIKVPQGAKIRLTGKAPFAPTKGEILLAGRKAMSHLPTAKPQKQNIQAEFMAPGQGAFVIQLWDSQGHVWKSRIHKIMGQPDQAPHVEIIKPETRHEMSFGERVRLLYATSDDYGVQEIYLWHRRRGSDEDFRKRLVARFPKSPKRNHRDNYLWNPVVEEGKKMPRLIYPPGTEAIEYYLQARDNNFFNQRNTSRSKIHYIKFTDKMAQLSQALNQVRDIADQANKLSQKNNPSSTSPEASKLTDKIQKFRKNWPDKWRKVLPRDRLIQQLQRMQNSLKANRNVTESAAQLSRYLSKYITMMQMLVQANRMQDFNRELSNMRPPRATKDSPEKQRKNMQKMLSRTKRMLKWLKKDHPEKIEEIEELIKKGRNQEAFQRMRRLLNQVRQELRQNLQAMQQKIKKLDKKLRKELQALKQKAQTLIQQQKKNITRTRQGQYTQADNKQKQINKELGSIYQTTRRLSQDYPFILHNLKGEAHIAKIMGDTALEKLQKRDRRNSLDAQKKVTEHLKSFLKQISKQKKRYKNIMNGNFSGILPQSLKDRFVIIPKKGSTEVPMDYRDQIIENSKKRQNVSPETEKFWRNLLH